MGKGCVLIHGFTGSPKEIEIIANYLQAKGIEVSTPTLPGHGVEIKRKDMKAASWKDWIEIADKAVQEMTKKHEEVYLVGFSMGAVISAYLATKYPIKKLVLLSASVFYMSAHSFLTNLKQKPLTKSQLKRYIYKIKQTPFRATFHFRKLVKQLVPYISLIEIDTLIIHGEQDDLADPRSSQYIYNTIKSKVKHLHLLPKSKHIVCWDEEKEKVIELVDKFLIY